MRRVRCKFNYANVMSTVAVFVAVGGTSYAAVTLPDNSVGSRQLKSGAVGAKELKRGAVGSRALRNGGILRRDLSAATVASLTGAQGPQGPPGPPGTTLRAAISSAGSLVSGNATSSDGELPNRRLIGFARGMAGCVPTATLARNAGGATTNPGPGRIVVAIQGNAVAVETFNATGAPEFLPFNVIVAC